MTKSEFLTELRKALANDLDGTEVEEHVSYYAGYINDEVAKGRSEAEVVEELGDPWTISRNIVGMKDVQEVVRSSRNKGNSEYTYEEEEDEGYSRVHTHSFALDTWWKRLAAMLVVAGAFIVVMTIIGGLLSLFAPLLIPILLVLVLVRVFRQRRG